MGIKKLGETITVVGGFEEVVIRIAGLGLGETLCG